MTSSPGRPSSLPPVQYKGSDLDAERGPGLGCFWIQLVVLAVLVVITPIGVNAGWPDWLNALLLFATIGLLLISGQTIIFLLRIVAAERREGRRRPMAVGRSRTVGELEDEAPGQGTEAPSQADEALAPDELEVGMPTAGPEASKPAAEPDAAAPASAAPNRPPAPDLGPDEPVRE